MHALAAQEANHLLAKATQADAVARYVGIFGDQPHDVAQRRITLHAQQQVGPTEVKEAQRMALHDLAPIHQAPQLVGGGGNLHAENCVAGLRRGHQMADRTDAANAGRDARHLPEAASLAEFFKSSKLGYVETCIIHLAGIVQMNRNFGMTLNACHRVNDYCLCHHTSPD